MKIPMSIFITLTVFIPVVIYITLHTTTSMMKYSEIYQERVVIFQMEKKKTEQLLTALLPRNGIHQIVIRTLSTCFYMCQQLAYLVLNRIFLQAGKIGELLRIYQEYPAKSVGKQGEEFLIAAVVKS
jgi:hypothetical protein